MSRFDSTWLERFFQKQYIIGTNGLVISNKKRDTKVIVMRTVREDQELVTDHVFLYKMTNAIYHCASHHLVTMTNDECFIHDWT